MHLSLPMQTIIFRRCVSKIDDMCPGEINSKWTIFNRFLSYVLSLKFMNAIRRPSDKECISCNGSRLMIYPSLSNFRNAFRPFLDKIHTLCVCSAKPNDSKYIRQQHDSGTTYEPNFSIGFDSAMLTTDPVDSSTLARH